MKKVLPLLIVMALPILLFGQHITTLAGLGPAATTTAPIYMGHIMPTGLVVAPSGIVFVVSGNTIQKADPVAGTLSLFAGTGSSVYSGEGGPASAASFGSPSSICRDAAGNIYFFDNANVAIRKISPSGIITTFAGTGSGSSSFSGDGGPATAAGIGYGYIACDAGGNVFLTDRSHHRVRKISGGIINTIAGTGVSGYTSSGSAALGGKITRPERIAVSTTGEVYFVDSAFIRKIDASGILTTVAGNGTTAAFVDGVAATASSVDPRYGDMILDPSGNLYFSQGGTNGVRKVSTAGTISHFAGQYNVSDYAGDGGTATAASFNIVYGMGFDAAGNMYLGDWYNYLVRKISSAGIVSTFAGNNFYTYTGDSGTAASALARAGSITTDTLGNIYFIDELFNSIRKIDTSGHIHWLAGNGTSGYLGDGGPARKAEFGPDASIAADKAGNIYLADRNNNRIRKISTAGIISTYIGSAGFGNSGDGGPATAARIGTPAGIARDDAGNIYFSDNFHHVVRKVNTAGIISTIGGTGVSGFSGDGGPATAAMMSSPVSVACDTAGNVYVADYGKLRLRKISATGIISSVAGTGVHGGLGNGGPATAASVNVNGITVDRNGAIYFSNIDSFVVRKIDASGIVNRVAGNNTCDYTSGDGGHPFGASLCYVSGVHTDRSNNLYIGHWNRLRFVCSSDTVATYVSISATKDTLCAGESVTFSASVIGPGMGGTYQWRRNGANVPGATAITWSTTTIANGDSVQCIFTNTGNLSPCAMIGSFSSPKIGMTVIPHAPTPAAVSVVASPAFVSFAGETITYTASYINGGTAPQLQWYKNGVLLPGAVANPYITTDVANGDVISVLVRNTDPCALPDTASGRVLTGFADPVAPPALTIFPNPAKGYFTVQGAGAGVAGEMLMRLTDVTGKLVWSAMVTTVTGSFSYVVHLPEGHMQGLYFLCVESGGRNYYYKVVLE